MRAKIDKYGLGVLLFVVLFTIFYTVFRGNDFLIDLSGSLTPVILAALSTIATFFTAKHLGLKSERGLPWILFSIGLLLWFFGEVTWAYYALFMEIELPYPSYADVAWVIGYAPLLIGMLLEVNRMKKEIKWKGILITAVITILLSFTVMNFLVVETLSDEEAGLYEKIAGLAYPIGDLLLVIGGLLVWSVYQKKFVSPFSSGWILFVAGIILTAFGDWTFTYFTLKEFYPNNLLPDVLLDWGYAMMIIGALISKHEVSEK